MQAELPTKHNRNIPQQIWRLLYWFLHGLEHCQGKQSHCVYGLPSFSFSEEPNKRFIGKMHGTYNWHYTYWILICNINYVRRCCKPNCWCLIPCTSWKMSSVTHWVKGSCKYHEIDPKNPVGGLAVVAIDGVSWKPDTPRRSRSSQASYQSKTAQLKHFGWSCVFWGLMQLCLLHREK